VNLTLALPHCADNWPQLVKLSTQLFSSGQDTGGVGAGEGLGAGVGEGLGAGVGEGLAELSFT
jgi:hypothetical protein